MWINYYEHIKFCFIFLSTSAGDLISRFPFLLGQEMKTQVWNSPTRIAFLALSWLWTLYWGSLREGLSPGWCTLLMSGILWPFHSLLYIGHYCHKSCWSHGTELHWTLMGATVTGHSLSKVLAIFAVRPPPDRRLTLAHWPKGSSQISVVTVCSEYILTVHYVGFDKLYRQVRIQWMLITSSLYIHPYIPEGSSQISLVTHYKYYITWVFINRIGSNRHSPFW